MNSIILINSIRFLLLLAAQIVLFNNFDFLGFVNPYPYILFIILFPVNGNKYTLLLSSFFLGLLLDVFLNSGGVHTIACIVLAAIRPWLFRFSFGLSYEYQTVKINDSLTPERFSFVLLAVFIHHFVLFSLEIFSAEYLLGIIIRTLASTLFTLILCLLIIQLLKPSKR